MSRKMIEPGHTIGVHDCGFVRYIDRMGSDQRIVEAARISYMSPSKGPAQDKKLLDYLFRNRHTSPFEMCKITFNIRMPIFVWRQYIRHRMQNLNEVSGRYSVLPNDFFRPDEWRIQGGSNKQGSVEGKLLPVTQDDLNWKLKGDNYLADELDGCYHSSDQADALLSHAYDTAYSVYETLLNMGVAKEQARICLPVGLYTEIYACWDLNNLLKFFALRDDPHAQGEHQDYAKAMKAITRKLFPWTMAVYDKYEVIIRERTTESEVTSAVVPAPRTKPRRNTRRSPVVRLHPKVAAKRGGVVSKGGHGKRRPHKDATQRVSKTTNLHRGRVKANARKPR